MEFGSYIPPPTDYALFVYDAKYMYYNIIIAILLIGAGLLNIFLEPKETEKGFLKKLTIKQKTYLLRISGSIFLVLGLLLLSRQIFPQ